MDPTASMTTGGSDEVVFLSSLDDFGDDENVAPHARSHDDEPTKRPIRMLAPSTAGRMNSPDASRPATAGSEMDVLHLEDSRPSVRRQPSGAAAPPEDVSGVVSDAANKLNAKPPALGKANPSLLGKTFTAKLAEDAKSQGLSLKQLGNVAAAAAKQRQREAAGSSAAGTATAADTTKKLKKKKSKTSRSRSVENMMQEVARAPTERC